MPRGRWEWVARRAGREAVVAVVPGRSGVGSRRYCACTCGLGAARCSIFNCKFYIFFLHMRCRREKTRTDLTGAVDITCVWKLKGLGVDAGVGTIESPASSSPDMAGDNDGGTRKLALSLLLSISRSICRDECSSAGSSSGKTKVGGPGGGVAVSWSGDGGRISGTESIQDVVRPFTTVSKGQIDVEGPQLKGRRSEDEIGPD